MDDNGRLDVSNVTVTSSSGRKLNNKSVLDHIEAENRSRDYSNRALAGANDVIAELREIAKNLEKLPQYSEKHKKVVEALREEADAYYKEIESGEVTTLQLMNHSEAQMKLTLKAQEAITEEKIKAIEANKKLNQYEKESLILMTRNSLKLLNDRQEAQKQLNKELKEAEKILTSPTTKMDKFAASLGNAGKKLSDLSNTLNLDKLANAGNLFGANEKLNMMNTVSMQYGLSSGGFNNFKNEIITNIQNTNNAIGKSIFGADDMKSYMNKFKQLGITNINIAKQQASASITATKYLGVSDETQSKMFTFMKRTNDYTMLDKHNKTIVGLLNAQLGVSREQLDTMTQSTLDTADKLYSMGYSSDMISNLTQDQLVMGAALSSASGNTAAGDIWTSFMNKALTSTASDAGVFAPVVQQVQQAFESGASQGDMLRILQQNPFINNMMDIMQNGSMQQRTEATQAFTAAGFDSSIITLLTDIKGKEDLILSDYTSAGLEVANTDDNKLNTFLNGIKTTFAQTFLNKASLAIEKLPWGMYMNLANAAFGLYIAEGGLKLISSAAKILFKKGGGLSDLFTKFLGKGSALESATTTAATNTASAGSSLLSMIGPIAAAVGVIAGAWGIAKSILNGHNNRSNLNASDIRGDEGISASLASEYGVARDLSSDLSSQTSLGHKFTNKAGTLVSGTAGIGMLIGRGVNSLFSKTNSNYVKDNKTLIDWYFNTNSGKYNESQLRGQMLAFAYMLDSVDSLSSLDITKQDLKDQIKNGNFEKYLVQAWADALYEAGWKMEGKDRQKASPKIDTASYGAGGPGFINRSYYSGYGIGGASYPWPVTAGWPNYPQEFGGGRHTGIDFGIPQGTAIGSAESGTVVTSSDGWNSGYGNYTIVRGDSGRYYLYAHMSQRKTNIGDRLNKGNLIGLSGNTGNSTGPHLHYEVRSSSQYGSDISPYPYINDGLFNASGSSTTLTRGPNSEDVARIPTKKFAANASMLKNTGGPTLASDNTDVVEAVSSGFAALMKQIDNLSKRQDAQQQILESFSKSQSRDVSLGELVY